MLRLVLAILLLGALMPSGTWANDGQVGQAVSSTLKASMQRQGLTPEQQATTWARIKAYLNSAAVATDSWIRMALNLGVRAGSNITSGSDFGGGAGAELSWCEDFKLYRDVAGNYIVPTMKLPDPGGYAYGGAVWASSHGNMDFNTGDALSAIKVGIHMMNLQLPEHLRYAPVYVTFSDPTTRTVLISRPAYSNSGTITDPPVGSATANRNTVAWSPDYAGGPPPLWSCSADICTGSGAGHWQGGGVMRPSAWAIPSTGVVKPIAMALWSKNAGELGLCPLDTELIRQIADRAWALAAAQPGYNGAPYGRVEREDVRNGGKQPTVADTGQMTTPDPTATPSTPSDPSTPQPTPTPTETDGPDWTDPGTGQPNPQSPTAQSIVDKAFDWGFPAIEINLGSATCPVYTADFFGHTLTLDSHCPFIEQNRAIISAMMILLFTIASGIIILRA